MGWFFSNASKSDLIKELTQTAAAYEDRGSVVWAVKKVCPESESYATHASMYYIECNLMRKDEEGRWGHQTVHEGDAPYYYDCPLEFLVLTPVLDAKWREKVWAYHARRTVG